MTIIKRKMPCSETEQKHLTTLFAGWEREETMIRSCLEGIMGDILVPDTEVTDAAAAHLHGFCFLAGVPDTALVSWHYETDFLYMVPQDAAWASRIETVWGSRAKRCTRYAIKKEPLCFDPVYLARLERGLPPGYRIVPINEEMYRACLSEDWSADFVSGYRDYHMFSTVGLGFVVLHGTEIVAGASSYSSYSCGIEIEIDTKESCRKQGLATAVGAHLILACLARGLYPSWDAHNLISVRLAEKLGYTFDYEYPVYEIHTGYRKNR